MMTMALTDNRIIPSYVMRYRLPLLLLVLCIMSACAGNRHSDWDDIDYSRIARQNQARENDPNYVQPVPTAIGCSDDDLYNCK